MIRSKSAPASPLFAGRFESQISGFSEARMSAKSPPLFTLSGANSMMSTAPDQSSLCLISSQLRLLSRSDPPEPLRRPYPPDVRMSAH